MMLRILTVINQYYPYTGGAENVAQQIVEHTNSGGYRNDVLTVAYRHIEDSLGIKLPLDETVMVAGSSYRIFRLRPFRILWKQLDVGVLRYYLLLKMIVKIVQLSKSYDLVHAHTFYWPSYAAVLAKKICKIPVIVTGHNVVELLMREVDSGVYPHGMLACLKQADVFVAISSQIRDEAIQLAKIESSRVVQIYNSVDTERFHRILVATSRSAILKQYGVQPHEIVVTYHGRFHESKDVSCLVSAISRVKKKGFHVKCIMHGRGDSRDSLVQLIDDLGLRDVAHVYGYVDHIEAILGVSDIYVLPSLIEGLPLALLEAMAAGNICIATDIPGTNEILEHGRNGFLFDPCDVEALAGHIIHICEGLIHGDKFIEAIRTNCAQTVEDKFTRKAMIDSYRDLFLKQSSN